MRPLHGILIVDKAVGSRSFDLVSMLRKRTAERTIGHAGTLDPLASGVMILLIGAPYTRLASTCILYDKEYVATVHLGMATSTYDREGEPREGSDRIPSHEEVEEAIAAWQGKVWQTPPMFSAKKIGGKKLYHLARRGIEIQRPAVQVELAIDCLAYEYPYLRLRVRCSKGTYIRSLAHDLGLALKTGAYLDALQRTRSGPFTLAHAVQETHLLDPLFPLSSHLLAHL